MLFLRAAKTCRGAAVFACCEFSGSGLYYCLFLRVLLYAVDQLAVICLLQCLGSWICGGKRLAKIARNGFFALAGTSCF